MDTPLPPEQAAINICDYIAQDKSRIYDYPGIADIIRKCLPSPVTTVDLDKRINDVAQTMAFEMYSAEKIRAFIHAISDPMAQDISDSAAALKQSDFNNAELTKQRDELRRQLDVIRKFLIHDPELDCPCEICKEALTTLHELKIK